MTLILNSHKAAGVLEHCRLFSDKVIQYLPQNCLKHLIFLHHCTFISLKAHSALVKYVQAFSHLIIKRSDSVAALILQTSADQEEAAPTTSQTLNYVYLERQPHNETMSLQ